MSRRDSLSISTAVRCDRAGRLVSHCERSCM